MVPTPLNLKPADEQGSDAFFNALLKSCATPITSSRASSDYESIPEPFDYHKPPKLHRKHSRAAKFTTKNAVEEEESRKLFERLEQKANVPAPWPTRSSSMRRWKKCPKSVDSGYQPSSLRTSFESTPSTEYPCIEDGYDQYSDQRHEVIRNHGFWPRPNGSIESRLDRPRQDYDNTFATDHKRRAHKDDASTPRRGRAPYQRPELAPEKPGLRRSLLFEPHHPTPVSFQPLQTIASSATIVDTTLCPPPLQIRKRVASSDSAYDSNLDPTCEHSSIFQPRSPNTIYSSSPPWPHNFFSTNETKTRPPFKDPNLETYRLSDPGMLQNIDKPMPNVPYLSLSWQTVSREEYIMALGYHAMTMGVELPLIYAAKPDVGKKWVEEDGVAEAADKYNDEVEEACKLQLGAMRRVEDRDMGLNREHGREGTIQGGG